MTKNIYGFIAVIMFSSGLYAAAGSQLKELYVEMPHGCVAVRFDDAMTISALKMQILKTLPLISPLTDTLLKPKCPGYVAGSMVCKGPGNQYLTLEDHKKCIDYKLQHKDSVCCVFSINTSPGTFNETQ